MVAASGVWMNFQARVLSCVRRELAQLSGRKSTRRSHLMCLVPYPIVGLNAHEDMFHSYKEIR